MKKEYYAHSKQGSSIDGWQKLEDHLYMVARKAALFAAPFKADEWAYAVGILHDIGKYSDEFQDMLLRSINEETNDEYRCGPDHSSAGAQEIDKRLPDKTGKLLAYCVAGHHAGLLDGQANGACLNERLKKALKDYSARPSDLLMINKISGLPINFEKSRVDIAFQVQFFVRMIFSCLVDADFLDTESFMDRIKHNLRPGKSDLVGLRDKVVDKIKNISNDKTFVNRMRHSVFKQCMKRAHDKPGFFSLTAPTGGGKTLSSLAFALEHAIEYGMERVIYIIPYTCIIEQNAAIFREVCGDEAVLEHHCNFDLNNDSYKSRLAVENWDAPLIVTTNVQFFETLFSHRPSKCRKAHNIANSVIILDEAQMLPVNLLKPCLSVMKELVKNYNSTFVLCTATQPALNYSDEFKSGLEGVREISEDPKELYKSLKRVSIEKLHEINNDDLIKKICKEDRVLCVVNTRKQARQLYESISEKEGLYHLSALMCPAHRKKVLDCIRDKLKAKSEICRVISTQLIEAGVDIDFPVVFRAQSGIDSIAQSAGRCNREGKLSEGGKVYVFTPEHSSPPGFLRQSAETAQSIARRYEDILSIEAVDDYFRELYWRNEDRLDKNKILDSLAKDLPNYNFPFRTVGEEFRLIDTGTQAIVIPYNEEARKLITELETSDSKTIARKLQRFSVQVYPDVILKLGHAALKPLYNRYHILINDHLYKEDIGLDWDNPYFRDIEGNIC